MKKGLRHTEILLVLTEARRAKDALLAWRPFERGNSLGEIITAHNLRLSGCLQQKSRSFPTDCVMEITPILKVESHGVTEDVPYRLIASREIRILLVAPGGADNHPAVGLVVQQILSRLSRPIHVVQLGEGGKETRPGSALPATAVCRNQMELELFLATYRDYHQRAWLGSARNPFDELCQNGAANETYILPSDRFSVQAGLNKEKVCQQAQASYREKLPALIADIRDTAMLARLTEEQTANLGRSAAIQEYLLQLVIEQVRPRPDQEVMIETIRSPLGRIPADRSLETDRLRQIKLIAIRLRNLRKQPAKSQRESLRELGFIDSFELVVHLDCPEVRKCIEKCAQLIECERLVCELPEWSPRERPKQALTN